MHTPSRAALVGVMLLVLTAVGIFAVRVAWARSNEPVPVVAPGGAARDGPRGAPAAARVSADPAAGAQVPAAGDPGATGSGGSAGTSRASPQVPAAATVAPAPGSGGPGLVVHVVGEVRRPGVVHLPVGARVEDAVRAAGGATPRARLDALNLARPCVDGEQLRVPRPGEVLPGASGQVGPGSGGTAPGGTGTTSGGGALVSINAADAAALDTLPGVGPVLAQRILDWRAEHGRFTSIDELGEVSGIGEKLLERLRPKVTL